MIFSEKILGYLCDDLLVYLCDDHLLGQHQMGFLWIWHVTQVILGFN